MNLRIENVDFGNTNTGLIDFQNTHRTDVTSRTVLRVRLSQNDYESLIEGQKVEETFRVGHWPPITVSIQVGRTPSLEGSALEHSSFEASPNARGFALVISPNSLAFLREPSVIKDGLQRDQVNLQVDFKKPKKD
jgi:hypothetical protein